MKCWRFTLIFLSIFINLAGCHKDKFPRISKCNIEVNSTNTCKVDLVVVDLSENNPTEYGLIYSTNPDFSSSQNILGTKPLKKGHIETIDLSGLDCTKDYYLRPFIKEDSNFLYGNTIEYKKFISNLKTAAISSCVQKSDSIIINYTIPTIDCISFEEIILCYVFNESREILITDNPIKLQNMSGSKIYSFSVPNNGNGYYKFNIFTKYCNSHSHSNAVQLAYVKDNSPKNCIAQPNAYEFQQKSINKFLIKSGINTNDILDDYGFIVNGKPFSVKVLGEPVNNFQYLYAGKGGSLYTIRSYYKCLDTFFGLQMNFTLPLRKININKAEYSNDQINATGDFTTSSTNFISLEHGLCYSNSNKVPKIDFDSKAIIKTDININPLVSSISNPTKNSRYYMRFYVKDCDETFYSDTTSIYIPNSSNSVCNFNNELLLNNTNNYGYINPATFVLNGTIYIGGGNTGTLTTDILFYLDISTKQWKSTKDRIPLTNSGQSGGVAASFSINNIGYLLERNATYMQVYDPSNDVWRPRISFPGSKIQYAIGLSTSNKGYIIGGQKYADKQPYNFIWEFDPLTEKFTQKYYDTQLNDRINAGSFVINDQIYIFGGEGNLDSRLWKFNPSNNNWTNITSLPTDLIGCKDCISTVLNGKAYVINIKLDYQVCWEFDPIKIVWNRCVSKVAETGEYGFGAYSVNKSFFGYANFSNPRKIIIYNVY